MSSRFSEAFVMRLAGADGISDAATVTPLDGTEAAQVASFKTVPVFVKDLDAYSIQFSTPAGSTLVGTLTLQVSNDRSSQEQTGKADPGTVTNFVPISFWDWGAGAQAPNKAVATAANQILIGDRVCGYRWVQLVFTFTSGSGSPKVAMQQKGVS